MDSVYQYQVFFECSSLDEEQKKKIENYFQIRRRSGGGECGPLKKLNDTFYSIAFKDQTAQQRVLQKSEHEVGGLLTLAVRGSLEPRSSSPIATPTPVSPNLDFTNPSQTYQPIPASTASPSGAEYELQLDMYLLRYLKECPRAGKALEEELAAVACCAQLYPEEGRVSVRRLDQIGSVAPDRDGVKQWEADVDKMFGQIKERYLCYFEVDPRKIKVLLRSCSSDRAIDEVKVYSQVGLAVVVGEHSQVRARLKEVEDLCVQSQRSVIGEKKTTTRRLGEAKLCLLWKEIEHGLGQDVPGLKVTQGDAGQLVLEGSVEEIVKAGDWISEKETLVLERTVSDISPHLLTFLRKAYEGPGVLGDVLGIDDKVKIEIGDTELRVLSLSSGKLDETEKALQSKFREIKVDVPDCLSVPPELKVKLDSKANQMNRSSCRVIVRFASGSRVHLLGYTEEVEELNEVITQFILDQFIVETTVPLPYPDLADFLLELLQVNGCDQLGVSFYRDTSHSCPVVILKGPSSRVNQVLNTLGPLLDDMCQEKATTDQPEAELCKGGTTVAQYHLHCGLQVLVCQGDITKEHADALVNAANEDLDHSGGVASALSHAGGPEVQEASRALIKDIGKILPGDVVQTTGGNLNCKVLLHAVGPIGGKVGGREKILVEETVQTALQLAESMELQSIAIPCISSGTFGVPITVCTEAIVTAVKEFGSYGDRSLRRVTLIDTRVEVVRAMQEACDRLLQGIDTGNSSRRDFEFPLGAAASDTAGAAHDGVQIEIIEGLIETQQVDALVSPMLGHNPLSTRVGNNLYEVVGHQLTSRFRLEAGEVTSPGDAVSVEGLLGLSANTVFFLNLLRWDSNQHGPAIQVLKNGVRNILAFCDKRGFGSIAVPALGTGAVLRFPHSVAVEALLEEVHAFEQTRVSRTPFLVCFIVHPNDKESRKAFLSAQKALEPSGFTKDAHQHQDRLPRRIVLLGKTGSGKSSLANTIFGETVFNTDHSANSGTSVCQAETRSVNGRNITLIDTPGFFDTDQPKEELRSEIVRCVTECAPGPHAFLIVLKVEKFTEHEKDVIAKICQFFSEEAFKYATVVFTHGNQLPKGVKIEKFVSENEGLSDLVKKCGGRCHVVDSTQWNNHQQDDYRSNQFQVAKLLNTIDEMVMGNNGSYYTNEMLQVVEREIQKEEEKLIEQSSGEMSLEEIRNEAKNNVSKRLLIKLAGTATGALLGALLGVTAFVGLVLVALQHISALTEGIKKVKALATVAGVAGRAAAGGGAAAGGAAAGASTAGIVLGVTTAAFVVTGGVVGGVIGHNAAEEAETVGEAVEKAAHAVWDKAEAALKGGKDVWGQRKDVLGQRK